MTNRNNRRISTAFLLMGTNGYRSLWVTYRDRSFLNNRVNYGRMVRGRISWR